MVMLAVVEGGGKLPPYVIFKRKALPKANFPVGMHVQAQEKGWMPAGSALSVEGDLAPCFFRFSLRGTGFAATWEKMYAGN